MADIRVRDFGWVTDFVAGDNANKFCSTCKVLSDEVFFRFNAVVTRLAHESN